MTASVFKVRLILKATGYFVEQVSLKAKSIVFIMLGFTSITTKISNVVNRPSLLIESVKEKRVFAGGCASLMLLRCYLGSCIILSSVVVCNQWVKY